MTPLDEQARKRQLNTQNIYILDDDHQYAHLLKETISSLATNISVSTDPKLFITQDMAEGSILILDLIMPDMDGIEIIQALAARPNLPSLVLISGFHESSLHSAKKLAEAHKIKVLGSFNKPINLKLFQDFMFKELAHE